MYDDAPDYCSSMNLYQIREFFQYFIIYYSANSQLVVFQMYIYIKGIPKYSQLSNPKFKMVSLLSLIARLKALKLH